MNRIQLKTAYPLLANEHNNTMYRLQEVSSNCKYIFDGSNKLDDEETEINYLRELEVFLKDIHNTEIKRINNRIDMRFDTLGWFEVAGWLVNIPKKLIMDLLNQCEIYPSGVTTSEKKEEWCKVIYTQIHTLFSKEKSAIRIDKLIEQHTPPILSCNKDLIIDKWFKVILHIVAYKNYRKLLEGELKKTDTKIKVLKNTKIVVKKNI